MRFMMLMIPKGYENAKPGVMPDAKAVFVESISAPRSARLSQKGLAYAF